MDLVSVIIPNLHSPVIGQTLAALGEQDYRGPFEVIIVGQDQYGLVQQGGNIRSLVTSQPTPPGIARNLGVKASKGELLIFLDADCIPGRDWLRRHVEHYSDPYVDVVGGGVTFPTENYWTLAENLSMFYDYLASSPAGVRDQLPSLNLSVRRVVMEKVGWFQSRPAGEDSDFTTRLRQAGFLLNFDPLAYVTHLPKRRGASSFFHRSFNFGRYSIKVERKYMGYLQTPEILRHWFLTLLGAPILAAGVIFRMLRRAMIWQNLHTVPVIYLAKVVWCFGAAETLRDGSVVVYNETPAPIKLTEKEN